MRAGEDRLEAAVALAAEHADGFPPGSKLAVDDHRRPEEAPRFAPDVFGAKTRLSQLEVGPVTVPLDGRIGAAVDLHVRDRERTLEELGLLRRRPRRRRTRTPSSGRSTSSRISPAAPGAPAGGGAG